jgi:Putative zinc-finger
MHERELPLNPEPHPSREELYAYRDGELTADRRVTVEAHVLNCRACRESMDEVSELEALLRSRPDHMDESYYESLSERTMERVQALAIPSPLERRKIEAEAEWQEKRSPAPRLPWAAIASAVSAAAAVVVVVVLLAREGAFWNRAPQVAVLERSAPDAARTRATPDTTVPPVPGPPSRSAQEARKSLKGAAPAPSPAVVQNESAPQAAREGKTFAKSEEEPVTVHAPTLDEKVAIRENAGETDQARSLSMRPMAAAPSVGGLGAGSSAGYDAFVRRYGLPPLWGPGVSDEQILRAEGALRNFYRYGGAKSATDSARARLYLAEAARIHAGSSPDSASIAEIDRHYRRAITLAHDDPATAAVARTRLEQFLRQTGVWR